MPSPEAVKQQSQEWRWIVDVYQEVCSTIPGEDSQSRGDSATGWKCCSTDGITKADKSKLEISLKDLTSKHSSLKAEINFQLVCKTSGIKSRSLQL